MTRCWLGLSVLLAVLGMAWAQAPAPGPAVTISLGSRQARAIPLRQGFNHTGGGNIDVAQPAPDTVVLTMTGVAVAGAHPCKDSVATLQFDLTQGFEVAFEKPDVKKAKLTLEARVIGLLRSHSGGGAAETCAPYAGALSGPTEIVSVTMPPHAVRGGDNLSINDREGPRATSIRAGQFTLHQTFAVTASHPRCLKPCKAASAEFAPDPALDPLWISYWEPFHGAGKKDFGFQVILKAVPE